MGRRVVLPVAALLIAGGMGLEGVAPTWPIFIVGAGIAGAGCGAIDALASSVIIDLSATGSGNSLNMLHLFYSVGALAAPLAIGRLVGLGIGWRLIAAARGLAGLALAAPLARAGAVPPRARSAISTAAQRTSGLSFGLQLALATLGVAIACYVAAESGVSSWLVGFLGDEPIPVATLALGLFWAGIAAGRLVASRVADGFDPVRFTASCALVGGTAILAAVAVTSGSVRITLFLAAGFAFGPVYPMIMAAAGSLFPHRAAAVAGIVTSAGVVGSITYPPLMGVIAGIAGLRDGLRRGLADLRQRRGSDRVWSAGRRTGRRGPSPSPSRAAKTG